MIFGQPNFLATVALAAWFPLSFLAFWLFRPSVAAALTVIFLAFILLFSVIQTFILDKRVHY